MAFASGSNHSMGYVAESAYGVTPATPAFKPFRHTGTTLALSKETLQSEELRNDRQIAAFRHGNKQVGGDVNSELAFTDFDDMLEALFCGTWASDTLKVGTTRRSFTIERRFADIGQHLRYKGCEVNTFNLTVQPNANVTATFGIVGQDQDPNNEEITGATYPDVQGAGSFDSFSGTITEGGSAIAVVSQIEINLANGIEPNFVVGSDVTAQNTIGRSNLTGTLTAYFEDETLLNKFINETSSSLVFSLLDDAGNTIEFNIPNLKYGSGQPDVSSDGSVTVSLEFQALYDSVAQSNIVVTRTAA